MPQGTVLGPLLFLAFKNDLLECIRSKIKLFADDANMYRNIKEKEDHNTLQEDLENYSNLNKEWLLQPSKKKCEVLHVEKKQHHGPYILDEYVSNVRDLGVMVSSGGAALPRI